MSETQVHKLRVNTNLFRFFSRTFVYVFRILSSSEETQRYLHNRLHRIVPHLESPQETFNDGEPCS